MPPEREAQPSSGNASGRRTPPAGAAAAQTWYGHRVSVNMHLTSNPDGYEPVRRPPNAPYRPFLPRILEIRFSAFWHSETAKEVEAPLIPPRRSVAGHGFHFLFQLKGARSFRGGTSLHCPNSSFFVRGSQETANMGK